MRKHKLALSIFVMLLLLPFTLAGDWVELKTMDHQGFSGDLVSNLGLSADNELVLLRENAREDAVHRRYQQTYMGIPIYGEHVLVATRYDGSVKSLGGAVLQNIEANMDNPAFNGHRALKVAKGLHTYGFSKWHYRNESSELVIYNDDQGRAKLAYKVTFFADTDDAEPTLPVYLIDAHTEEVLLFFENLQTADGVGPGGNQKVGRYQYGTDFPAFEVTASGSSCSMDSTNVVTRDMKHSTSGSGTTHSFSCYENTYKEINGAYSPINDAHAGGHTVFNMFSDWYNTSPLTFKLTLRVHYGNSYQNAFWDGSTMTFGDGGSTFYPLTELGVVAHEVSHGFTQQNSNLEYRNQSGGINEAFSDMAAQGAIWYQRGFVTYHIGDDIYKSNGALRYMDDPPRDGRSIGCANDYSSGMDVHYSSGVFNKAYYLLATTDGWDPRKAFDVFVRANQDYWTSSSNFQRGAEGAVSAAKDLGYDCQAVVDAFDQVCISVTAPADCGTVVVGPTADFSSSISDLTVTFTNSSTAGDGTINSYAWNFGDGNTSTSENPSHSYREYGTYTVSLTVTDSNSKSDTVSKEITLDDGVNNDPVADFTFSISGLTVNFSDNSSDSDGNIASWSWDFGDGATSTSQNPSHAYRAAGDYRVSLTVTDNEGAQNSTSANITVEEPTNNPPVADFTYTINGLSVNFGDRSSDSDGSIASWSWNFGDGNSSSSSNPSHTYGAAGSYTVTLTVTDDGGASDSVSANITVEAPTYPSWKPYVLYREGDRVTWKGVAYECVWLHFSWPDSPPDVDPWGDWQEL